MRSTSRNSRRPGLQLRTQTPTWRSAALMCPSDGTETHIPSGSVEEEGSACMSTSGGAQSSVREAVCTADIELLSVSVPPFYLPREFPQIFITVVYIHPKASANNAVNTIHKVTQKLQTMSPDALSLIVGDFNQLKINEQLLSVHHMPY